MNRPAIQLVLLAAIITFAFPVSFGHQRLPGIPGVAQAQEDWKKEFEDLCARTQDSATIPADELKKLIERCDQLKLRIEKLEETQRKVYLKRLQMCHDMYAFMLETREKK